MKTITTEQLTEAVAYAWDGAKDQLNNTAWKPGEYRKLPLIKLYPKITDGFKPNAEPTIEPDYYCYVTYNCLMLKGLWFHRIIITAPHIDPTFEYIETWETRT